MAVGRSPAAMVNRLGSVISGGITALLSLARADVSRLPPYMHQMHANRPDA